jgi:hypothetical protein
VIQQKTGWFRGPLAPPGFYALDWAFLRPDAVLANQIEIEFLGAG